MRNFRDAKILAKSLRQIILDKKDVYIGRSESLEIVSNMFGMRDWNSLSNSDINECEGISERLTKLKQNARIEYSEVSPYSLQKVTGYYKHESGLLARFLINRNILTCEISGLRPIEFTNNDDRSFFSSHYGVDIDFHHNENGHIFCLISQQGRCSQWTKINIDEAVIIQSSLKHKIEKNECAPNTERFIRRFISGIINGTPFYKEMSPEHAKATYQQINCLQKHINNAGRLKSIKFIGVQDDGSDIYHVQHERRLLRWSIYLDSTSNKLFFSKVTFGG